MHNMFRMETKKYLEQETSLPADVKSLECLTKEKNVFLLQLSDTTNRPSFPCFPK